MIAVRDAVAADVAAITGIYNATPETTTHEWTEALHTVEEIERWRAERQAAGFPVLVAVDGGDVIGWATYGDFRDVTRWPGYRFTVEHSIHVAEHHLRRGVGRTLLGALAEHARAAGKRVMVAGIDSANQWTSTPGSASSRWATCPASATSGASASTSSSCSGSCDR